MLRECRDASHRIPPWHKFIPKDPTMAQVYPTGSHHAQVYPTGSHHGTAPPGRGSAPWPFLSQASLAAPLCLGKQTREEGKNLKGEELEN